MLQNTWTIKTGWQWIWVSLRCKSPSWKQYSNIDQIYCAHMIKVSFTLGRSVGRFLHSKSKIYLVIHYITEQAWEHLKSQMGDNSQQMNSKCPTTNIHILQYLLLCLLRIMLFSFAIHILCHVLSLF